MNIVLLGSTLRSGNRGVDALTRGTIELLAKLYGINQIKILRITREDNYTEKISTEKQDVFVEEICCSAYKLIFFTFLCLLRKTTGTLLDEYLKRIKFLDNLCTADFILDISEGDSFSDIYGKKRFIIHSFNKLIVIFLGKKLILLPQTIGPFDNYFIKKVAEYILKKTDKVLTRDELSYNLCCDKSGFNIEKHKVLLVPDMAFFMSPATHVDIDSAIDVEKDNYAGILIGINVSGLLYNGGYTMNNMFSLKVDYKSLINKVIYDLTNNVKVSILLVPHVITYGNEIVEDDLTVCKKIFEELEPKYPGRISYVAKPYREHELKQIISKCDFFIGARMHACIGAISMCVPTVPIAYSRKFIGVWKMFELESYVADPRTHTEEEIILMINDALNFREAIHLKLQNEMKQVKGKIMFLINKAIGCSWLDETLNIKYKNES